MGLFDFFKKKKPNPFLEQVQRMNDKFFPRGEKDYQAGANELLYILNNCVDYKTAKNIFVKSTAISRISESFDKERLEVHLNGYCGEHFNDEQVGKLYGYLNALKMASMLHGKTPCEVRREGSNYIW